MDMKALGYVIRRRRNALGVSQNQLAELIGYSGNNSVSRLENGLVEAPPMEVLQKIADALNVRLSQFIMEAEEHASGDAGELSVLEQVPPNVRRVPVISWVQAGRPQEEFNPYARGSASRWEKTDVRVGRRAYALEVKGRSMVNPLGDPSFPPGSVIIVDPDRQPENGAFVIVRFVSDEEATFKRYVREHGDTLLVPLNPQFPTKVVDREASFCGVVVSKAEQPLEDIQ